MNISPALDHLARATFGNDWDMRTTLKEEGDLIIQLLAIMLAEAHAKLDAGTSAMDCARVMEDILNYSASTVGKDPQEPPSTPLLN